MKEVALAERPLVWPCNCVISQLIKTWIMSCIMLLKLIITRLLSGIQICKSHISNISKSTRRLRRVFEARNPRFSV
ncbi:hypothetical protein L596_028268 [Steinernema carpocapsae]|uniref:Uncharacterized protein n=1 Tax=Steinernema carpocapsae TaxID=34508 RepID=A0A4V5ZXU0_STECR|nr:hypothetical protein L596_028268 [Steinernema carpocapsae]